MIYNYLLHVNTMVCGCNEKRKTRETVIEFLVLAIALGVVLVLFSLPILFYYVSVSAILIYFVNS